MQVRIYLPVEGQEKPLQHKHGGRWEQRQQLRGPAWGSALAAELLSATITMKPKGKEPWLPTSCIPSHCFTQRGSLLSAGGMQTERSMLCKSHLPIYCLTCSESHYRACISREQRGKMRTRSLCIPLRLELLSCYIPVHQE